MFGKLKQMLVHSDSSNVGLEAARIYLGPQFADDFQALADGKYKGNNRLEKRASGVAYLLKAVLYTKDQMDDQSDHYRFWREVALPSILHRYNLTLQGEYDPERFHMDAMDYSAVIMMLPGVLNTENTSVSEAMIDFLLAINSHHAKRGGYFGNTPYWFLHDKQVWWPIDHTFASIQAYWLILVYADRYCMDIFSKLVDTVLTENYSLNELEQDRLLGDETSAFVSFLTLGAIHFSVLKHHTSIRSKSLRSLVESIAPEASNAYLGVMNLSLMKIVSGLQFILPEDHILQSLPEDSISLNSSIKTNLFSLSFFSETVSLILEMPENKDIIQNPHETVPHLLYMSNPT